MAITNAQVRSVLLETRHILEYPGLWCQRREAKDFLGFEVRPINPRATQWSLTGAMALACERLIIPYWEVVRNIASEHDITVFNDAEGRTHDEVLEWIDIQIAALAPEEEHEQPVPGNQEEPQPTEAGPPEPPTQPEGEKAGDPTNTPTGGAIQAGGTAKEGEHPTGTEAGNAVCKASCTIRKLSLVGGEMPAETKVPLVLRYDEESPVRVVNICQSNGEQLLQETGVQGLFPEGHPGPDILVLVNVHGVERASFDSDPTHGTFCAINISVNYDGICPDFAVSAYEHTTLARHIPTSG